MLLIEEIIQDAIDKGASDIHLIYGLKPIIRVHRNLVEIKRLPILNDELLQNIYEYIVRGDVDKDTTYKKTRKLDTAVVYKKIRLRVNASFVDGKQVFTLRIIKNELPKFEDLGVPEVVRSMIYQPQGLMLVTGKTNSGKSTTLNCLIDHINMTQNRKILTLESPVEYRHTSKKSIIIQKEVGPGGDALNYTDGVKNALREDCDILVVGEIRDRHTMEAAIDMVESGHLVIGTLHTKSCAETIDRIINFYEISEQTTIKYLVSSVLKLVISQRLIQGTEPNKLVLLPEVMVVDRTVAASIRKPKFSVSEIEDTMQSNLDKGCVSFVNSLANLYIKDKITLEQAKAQIDEKNIDVLNRTIMQLKAKISH